MLADPAGAGSGRAGHGGRGRRGVGGGGDYGRVRVELEHLAPSVVGAELEIAAVLERVAGRRLEFAVRLHDGGRLVAKGMVTRVVVDTAAFLPDAGAGAAR